MTRKDYRVIAGAIRLAIRDTYEPRVFDVVDAISDALEANSPLDRNGNRSFDRERFLREAGVR